MTFVVKKDGGSCSYLAGTAERRLWTNLKAAYRFTTRKAAYEAALPAMTAFNPDVRVVQLIPKVPCPECDGTGYQRSSHDRGKP